ncbi:uncharacterized protein MKK02DRAFT_45155 [Dioszegia hungarica]|uniref:Uncharacterized protein n=1 Tax=Dioszegia hungarica TaxID=4972 RepID=A0AA38LVC0_9TREE|nr:uncharacterized protein MKK02DRAFT_45155 [Dioszegia hungarica]KAI9636448.1 hypothetical protein MKK02DRAFT_45155 [Dioszegia hungarica]
MKPDTLSILTSAPLFSSILSYTPRSTLSTCLRVSPSISHMAASILYRDISLIHILPPAIHSPPSVDTRSPFLQYVRTLRLPPHLLYDPALCTASIAHMIRLKTVIVPGDWQGWILCPNALLPIFGCPVTHFRGLRILITGLKSPAGLINDGLLQSDLLSHATEVILSIDYLNPVYRGPRQRVTAAMGGPRYSTDLPQSVKKLTILLPAGQQQQPRMRLPAGFDMGADSGFFHTPHGPGSGPDLAEWGTYKGAADAAPDLARVITGRKEGCQVLIVMEDGDEAGAVDGGENEAGGGKLQELKERTERLVHGILGSQGSEDGTADGRAEVKWMSADEWEGREEMERLLPKKSSPV